jgi:hypothetical protein
MRVGNCSAVSRGSSDSAFEVVSPSTALETVEEATDSI